MTFIDWEPRYEIGVDFVDRQHQQLVNIINRLHRSVEAGTGDRVLDGIFADLEVYTETHFKDEENAMIASDCPDLVRHQAAHREFIARVQQMRARFLAHEILADRVLDYLKTWLTLHILGTDRQCARYLARAEPRAAAEA
ncbi:MAG: hemerythrin family protein [Chrysiogenetes bacterium]|nr:hemerythrin family protein [Chrysiogenetes bacterium]